MKKPVILVFACLSLPCAASAAVVSVAGPGGTFFVSDNLLSGASDASYSDNFPGAGDQDTAQPDSWNGDRRWANGGAATSANWSFNSLTNGIYDVYASWRNNTQANVSLAHYTGTDGFATVDLDQRPGAAAHAGVVLNDGTRNVNFASLGQVTIADGNFTLTVDDSATGSADATTFIFADAVAIHQVPEPSSFGLLGLGFLALVRRRR